MDQLQFAGHHCNWLIDYPEAILRAGSAAPGSADRFDQFQKPMISALAE